MYHLIQTNESEPNRRIWHFGITQMNKQLCPNRRIGHFRTYLCITRLMNFMYHLIQTNKIGLNRCCMPFGITQVNQGTCPNHRIRFMEPS